MDQRKAFAATIDFAIERGYGNFIVDIEGTSLDQMLYMKEQITEDFSEAELGRWLGYIQGVLVANGFMTLEEANELDRRFAD